MNRIQRRIHQDWLLKKDAFLDEEAKSKSKSSNNDGYVVCFFCDKQGRIKNYKNYEAT